MSTIKSALWVAIVAVLSMPVAIQAQHAGHEAHEGHAAFGCAAE
jgi:hypothetical protein